MTLDEKLQKGDEDLYPVLCACGISCASCYAVKPIPGNKSIEYGATCDIQKSFIGLPKGTLCLKWRQRQGATA